jgi:hypothetical protein
MVIAMDSNQVIGWCIAALIPLVVLYAVARIALTKYKELPFSQRIYKSLEYLALGVVGCALFVGFIYFMGLSSLGSGILLGLALIVVVGFMLMRPSASVGAAATTIQTSTASPTPQQRFFCYISGQVVGPHDRAMLKAMRSVGQIDENTMLCVEGGEEWVPMSSLNL